MNFRPEKILAVQFKFFGDAVLLTPALRALQAHFPEAEIHLALPAEIAPIFKVFPAINRLWPVPRRRGRAKLGQSLPLLRSLRRERFDRAVDFGGNDRGAILSFISGAKQRLGWACPQKVFGCHQFYNQRVVSLSPPPHESLRLAQLLSRWDIPPPASLEPEIHADETLAGKAEAVLPSNRAVLFHVATGNRKKDWPVTHWAELNRVARAAGLNVFFTTPAGEREAALMAALQALAPDMAVLPPIPNLPLFLAVLKRADLFVSGDTGPMHFAAGLGVPTLSIFGPSAPSLTAPIGKQHRFLAAGGCTCARASPACIRASHCIAEISPEQVLAAIRGMLL